MASRLRTRLRFSRLGMLFLLLAGVAVVPGVTLALGLGEIKLDSALNERLLAEIPLVDLGDLQPDEIRVSLASAQDFDRVGVERFYFLEDLRFEVGAGTIRVFSSKPITEPYLNFLVQLQWPQGRLLKEYTLLLDPPTFSEAPAAAVAPAVQSQPTVSNAGTVERAPAASAPMVVAPAQAAADYTAPAPAATRASPERLDGNTYGMTDYTDTLWSIATLARPSSAVSIQQTMLAIQRLNPDAFLDGNINRMKAGMKLTMPTEEQATEIGAADALQQVAAQDRSWRGLREVATQDETPVERAAIDATPAQASAAAPPSGEGRLRIVAGSGDSVTGDPQAAPAVDQAALSAALEERDRLNLEVADLTGALDREKELAASQLDVKDRQLAVKDKQIAEMQAELKQLRETSGAMVASSKQDQSASPQTAWWQSPAVLGGGAGVLVLLLAGGLVAARRRNASVEVEAEAMPSRIERREPNPVRAHAAPVAPPPKVEGLAVRTTPAAAPGAASQPAQRKPEPRPEPAAAIAAVAGAAASAGATPDAGGELADVLGEADIYVAYGRYGQASALLQNALAEAPTRHDLRLKLLEIHAETGDRESFDRVRAELAERGANAEMLAAADALGADFAVHDPAESAAGATDGESTESVADDVGFDLDLFDGTETTSAPAASTSRGTMDARDFGFDRPGAAVPLAGAAYASATAHATDQEALNELPVFDEPLEETAPLEFDLEADELDAQSETSAVLDEALRAPERGLLGGDRGIDFRLEEDDLDRLEPEVLDEEIDGQASPEFEFADEGDSASTKLDLARAYSEMGDPEGAREILLEVLNEGSVVQQQAAQELLQRL